MPGDRALSLLVFPAPDVPGQWLGHCLELDIMSVGSSLQHAIRLTEEAVRECVADDLSHGLDPFARKPAPEEYFEEWRREGTRRTLGVDVPEPLGG
jgi:predicted RNase H-like HicB family nuclease